MTPTPTMTRRALVAGLAVLPVWAAAQPSLLLPTPPGTRGPFYPDHGLERIVAYHERQDARFAEAADEISRATGKPILTATELAVADPQNPGPATVRATGRLCYASANRAVTALEHLVRDARWRTSRQ